MELTEVVATRCSIHEYADESFDDETPRAIFENVVQTSSNYNFQSWGFVVLHEDETQQLLHKATYNQDHVTGVAASITVFGSRDPETRTETVTDGILEKGYLPSGEIRDDVFDNVADMADLPKQECRVQTAHSMSFVAILFIYAAWDEGVASCPAGGFDVDVALDASDINGEWYEPVILLAMGYPAEDADELQAERKCRRPVDGVIHFESSESGQSADPTTADDRGLDAAAPDGTFTPRSVLPRPTPPKRRT